jgi:hypothetical protein
MQSICKIEFFGEAGKYELTSENNFQSLSIKCPDGNEIACRPDSVCDVEDYTIRKLISRVAKRQTKPISSDVPSVLSGCVGFELYCDSGSDYSLTVIPAENLLRLKYPDGTFFWATPSALRVLWYAIGKLENGKVYDWIEKSVNDTGFFYHSLTTNFE